jgi:hypothetical protein
LGFDLSEVYLILDYQMDVYKYFDYDKCCFVEVLGRFSFQEKYRRINAIDGNVG